jgi:hypothetical protein
MLSEIETSWSATAFVGNDTVDRLRTVLAVPSDAFRLSEKRSHSEGDSFFYIAMRISRPRVRACRLGRRPLSA